MLPVLVDSAVVAVQGVSEAAGGAQTAGILAGVAPALVAPVPMGGDEVSIMLAQVAAAHGAQFLAAAAAGVGQRELLAETLAASATAYTAMNVFSQASLAL